jgi:uncharacterized protein involved in copper resistance
MRNQSLLLVTALLCSAAWGQAQNTPSSAAQPSSQQSMPGMDMSGGMHHDMSHMKDVPMDNENSDSEASAHVMHSMEGHMDMGPHMKMTALSQPKPGDAARAQKVAEQARETSEKYKDYHAALADGFKIFHPEIPQKMYHFTNYGYGIEGDSVLIPSILLRCSMKSMATTTG